MAKKAKADEDDVADDDKSKKKKKKAKKPKGRSGSTLGPFVTTLGLLLTAAALVCIDFGHNVLRGWMPMSSTSGWSVAALIFKRLNR